MQYNTIFLDMDGVICNFYLEAVRAHLRAGSIKPAQLRHYGTPIELTGEHLQNEWMHGGLGKSLRKWMLPKREGESDHEWMMRFWSPCRKADFVWENMEPYPWFKELIRLCQSNCRHLEICTTPDAANPNSYSGKVKWLHRMGLHDVQVWLNGRKAALSRPGTLLIDDYDKNVDKFVQPNCFSLASSKQCPINASSANTGVLHYCHGDGITFPTPWNPYHPWADDPVGYIRYFLENGYPLPASTNSTI